jgi:hypothetical protein
VLWASEAKERVMPWGGKRAPLLLTVRNEERTTVRKSPGLASLTLRVCATRTKIVVLFTSGGLRNHGTCSVNSRHTLLH